MIMCDVEHNEHIRMYYPWSSLTDGGLYYYNEHQRQAVYSSHVDSTRVTYLNYSDSTLPRLRNDTRLEATMTRVYYMCE